MELTEKRILRKDVRKTGHKVGLGLFLFFIIEFAAVFFSEIGIFLTFLLKNKGAEYEAYSESSGLSMIVGVVVGTAFLFLYFLPQKTHRQLFVRNRTLKPSSLLIITCMFIGCQLITEPILFVMEKLFNLFGLSAISSIEMASSQSTTLSMLLYAGFIGPIIEELIYRGFILRTFSKYGKTFSIIASSILFGIMHSNLPQAVFAFFIGLILGYVASEYTIIWSIVLHIFNNFVLGDVLGYALKDCSDNVTNIVYYSLMGVCLLAGVVGLIIKRKNVINYIKTNHWNKPYMRWTFTTVFIMIFITIHIMLGFFMLDKIV